MTHFKNLGEKNNLNMFTRVDPDRCEQMFYRMVFLSWKLPFKEKYLFVIVWISSQNKSMPDWKDWWRVRWVSRFSESPAEKKQLTVDSWENKKTLHLCNQVGDQDNSLLVSPVLLANSFIPATNQQRPVT